MERRLIPYEEDEQIAFVTWCHLNGILVHHSGNEIGGSTKALKIRAIKMKKMGTSKGFPDLLVFIPIKGVTKEIDAYEMAVIEMKRKKGGVVSKEQKEWITVLEMAGIPCKICKGADEAIDFIKSLVNNEDR